MKKLFILLLLIGLQTSCFASIDCTKCKVKYLNTFKRGPEIFYNGKRLDDPILFDEYYTNCLIPSIVKTKQFNAKYTYAFLWGYLDSLIQDERPTELVARVCALNIILGGYAYRKDSSRWTVSEALDYLYAKRDVKHYLLADKAELTKNIQDNLFTKEQRRHWKAYNTVDYTVCHLADYTNTTNNTVLIPSLIQLATFNDNKPKAAFNSQNVLILIKPNLLK